MANKPKKSTKGAVEKQSDSNVVRIKADSTTKKSTKSGSKAESTTTRVVATGAKIKDTKSKAVKADAPKKPRKKVAKNVFKSIGGYFKGAWYELRQVRWPNRKATWSLTVAVLLYSAFFVVVILALDAGFQWLFDLILGK